MCCRTISFHLCITKLSSVNLMLIAVMPGMQLPDGCRPRGLSALPWMQHRGAPVTAGRASGVSIDHYISVTRYLLRDTVQIYGP